MKVYKFGGASIKSQETVKNMADILKKFPEKKLVIVVSAMGKTTNNLENLFKLAINNQNYDKKLQEIEEYHNKMYGNLLSSDKNRTMVEQVFQNLKSSLSNVNQSNHQDMLYDELVSYGELLSSTIIYGYLSELGFPVVWIDARNFIKTDNTHREGKINWALTCNLIKYHLMPLLSNHILITQGFIGSTEADTTITLGREGSDFTAAIIAFCLNAESVTIWKDVQGILNADPKRFPNTKLFHQLSYQEAAEMTYYGASVIHPKTIKPLANKNIPLNVKSFESPDLPGTVIDIGGPHKLHPTFVIKDEQCLVSFFARDLAFINEKNLSIIFHVLDMLNIKINMMQNSAVSLTICVDNHAGKVQQMIDTLKNDFTIKFNENLRLITIKNYTPKSIKEVTKGNTILVEQRTRNTFQIVVDI